MIYATLCPDLALIKIKQHENECIIYNGSIPRKGEGRGFEVLRCCEVLL
jgi:hypothetical protein